MIVWGNPSKSAHTPTLTHLPITVVGGVGSEDTADLHIGKPLLQHFNYIPNTQLSTNWHTVKHLEENENGMVEWKKKRVTVMQVN